MITRHSSRENPLDESFLNQKLQNAQAYDRIAGYFRSSIFEVAGEALESVSGCIRVICNSDLEPIDVSTAKAAQQAMRKSWCAGQPELLPEANRQRFRKLYDYLISGKLQVRVLPDATFGLVHGKAGVITLMDGSKTSFLGSINESLTAWKLNYELLWEDDSSDAVDWVQHEFDTLWNHHHAVPLSDFVIADIKRIAEYTVPLVMGETTFLKSEALAWEWIRNPLPNERKHASFKLLRRHLGLKPSDTIASAESYNQLLGPDKTQIRRVLGNYGREFNPFILHIIRRTRTYLENTIDSATGEPYLQPVKVKLFGEQAHESIVLPFYFQRAYTLAEEFCAALSTRVKGAGFFKTLLLRCIGSTMYAGHRTVEKLLNEWNTEADSEIFVSEDEDDMEVLLLRQ